MSKIIVIGLGPGDVADITPAAQHALREADAVVGYKYYFRFVEPWLRAGVPCVDTGMKQERERAQQAFELAEQNQTVCVISSGDAGIYGMAPLVYEMKRERGSRVEVESVPGISAFQKAASLLGAPVGHDFCVVSLSDLMTPWATIERRIVAAAEADFVMAVYNPKSHGRYWQLHRLCELWLEHGRRGDTPVGIVRQAGREDQHVTITTLDSLREDDVDMFTVLIFGNSQSYTWEGRMITPRGYYHADDAISTQSVGQGIMTESFRTILSELQTTDMPLGRKWLLLHAIHTTADFEMEQLLRVDDGAVERIYEAVEHGRLRHIVTDVTMVMSGIRKAALARLGVEVHCYLSDARAAEMAAAQHITRTQAGIRLSVEEHPDALFAFGNAPTALMELCELMRRGKARPAGIVAAPVGFVHVKESKHMVKTFRDVPKIIIEGRKGGSNLAATLCNALLTFNDAAALRPGRDL